MLRKSKVPRSRRDEIEHLFQDHADGKTTLSASGLLRFLHQEQKEFLADEDTAEALIDRYEIETAAIESRSMTFEGFFRYMESKDCCVFDQAHTSVYQDMDQPLSTYFISSSHNTYLTRGQLVGESHLYGYVSALKKGCRCVEIDCWDGLDMEPVVYHGYTLTSKILFKEVIEIVSQHAFEVSAYPLILSLENHCCEEQQEVVAQYLISILGDKLLRSTLDNPTNGNLPSPNDLKYKILIKNKKLKSQSKAKDKREAEEGGDEGEGSDEEEEEDEEEDKESEGHQAKGKFWSPRKEGSQKKKKKVKVAQALSDLVIYTRSVKFVSFRHSEDNQTSYENTSIAEKRARKLMKASGQDFVQHTQRFLCRIYPAGSRIYSSNYNPQEFWNVGAQLVALNFQTLGLPMDLNNGRFLDNGGCGYVLKPAVLLHRERSFDPNSSQHHRLTPTNLMIRVMYGSNLPSLEPGKALNPFVRVEVHGIPSDSRTKNTHTVKNNCDPHWNAEMNFGIRVPELCLIRFSVHDQNTLFKSEFVGQYTLPFTSLKKGYRWVPLLSKDGCSLDPASLFVWVWYSQKQPTKVASKYRV
ncbi:1-phosphatidylinositol 4,5-bisphosphate phosphodiesterase zeta-1-like [Cyprinodon tularosa]|uniref:1-phosphatidylinositol 4,5-bisphosphate phosphodiesterase zeta-1-like n=1 Tax=Cyprinodon tularosa TaxID=77115 RepID=UPI0018E1E9E8|nr:1-phosphatidylinositol 4,5-bisphosphate phosphodiesterase zeta-1-like [Cyprinodon tularosa]